MEKNTILEALGKLLPQENVSEVATAVEAMVKEVKDSVESEFNEKLEAAYADLASELKEAEAVAEKGYQEAHSIILDLRNRLDVQKAEFEATLEEEYGEAYKLLEAEKEKNTTLEADLHTHYEEELKKMHGFFVDKIDEFFKANGEEISEHIYRNIINDPTTVESRVALEKITDIVASHVADDELSVVNSKKLEEAVRSTEELKGQVKVLEARNIRLSAENTKLNESVRHAQTVIKEHTQTATKTEKKERVEAAKNVEGRGKVAQDVEVIKETVDVPANKSETTLVEGLDADALAEFKVLAGL